MENSHCCKTIQVEVPALPHVSEEHNYIYSDMDSDEGRDKAAHKQLDDALQLSLPENDDNKNNNTVSSTTATNESVAERVRTRRTAEGAFASAPNRIITRTKSRAIAGLGDITATDVLSGSLPPPGPGIHKDGNTHNNSLSKSNASTSSRKLKSMPGSLRSALSPIKSAKVRKSSELRQRSVSRGRRSSRFVEGSMKDRVSKTPPGEVLDDQQNRQTRNGKKETNKAEKRKRKDKEAGAEKRASSVNESVSALSQGNAVPNEMTAQKEDDVRRTGSTAGFGKFLSSTLKQRWRKHISGSRRRGKPERASSAMDRDASPQESQTSKTHGAGILKTSKSSAQQPRIKSKSFQNLAPQMTSEIADDHYESCLNPGRVKSIRKRQSQLLEEYQKLEQEKAKLNGQDTVENDLSVGIPSLPDTNIASRGQREEHHQSLPRRPLPALPSGRALDQDEIDAPTLTTRNLTKKLPPAPPRTSSLPRPSYSPQPHRSLRRARTSITAEHDSRKRKAQGSISHVDLRAASGNLDNHHDDDEGSEYVEDGSASDASAYPAQPASRNQPDRDAKKMRKTRQMTMVGPRPRRRDSISSFAFQSRVQVGADGSPIRRQQFTATPGVNGVPPMPGNGGMDDDEAIPEEDEEDNGGFEWPEEVF